MDSPWTRRQALRLAGMTTIGGLLVPTGTTKGQSGESWPESGYDDGNTRYAPENTGPVANIKQVWRYQLDSIPAQIAIANETVFCDEYQSDGQLYSLEASSGTERWTSEGTKIEIANDSVYTHDTRNVLALNPTNGAERWRSEYTFSNGSLRKLSITADQIISITNNVENETSDVYSLGVDDGAEQWQFQTDGNIISNPAVGEDSIVVGNDNNYLYLIQASDGSERWRFRTQSGVISTILADGTVYFGGDEYVYAVDAATGSERWRFQAGRESTGSIPTASVPTAVAEGTVYARGDGNIYALSAADGTEQWRIESDGAVSAVVGDLIYAHGGRDVYTLNPDDGTEQWRFQLDDRLAGLAVANGMVYVGSRNNTVYALSGDTPDRDQGDDPTAVPSTNTQINDSSGLGEEPQESPQDSESGGDDSGSMLLLAGVLAAGAGGGLWYWHRDDEETVDGKRSDLETDAHERTSLANNTALGTSTSLSTTNEDDAVPSNTHIPSGAPDNIPRAPELSISYDELTEESPIGSGGNADVTKATFPTGNGGVTVAIKKPRMRGTLHTDAVERLLREAETWSKLDDHDHIVGILDYGAEPIPWIAIEYMDGGDIGDRAGSLSFDQAVWTAVAIVRGVRHAHRRGVAHLDLKPANVLFRSVEDTWDVPKVADWGLSKHLLDHSKSVEGLSPQYAAPEQFDDEYGAADDITDVYQLGTVLYELFTGRPPFEGMPNEIMSQVLSETPVPPSEIADVPSALDEILLTALAKKKSERYQSTLLLRNELQKLY